MITIRNCSAEEMLTIMRGKWVAFPQRWQAPFPTPISKESQKRLLDFQGSSVTCQVACKHLIALLHGSRTLAARVLWVRFWWNRESRPFGNVPGSLMLRSRDMIETEQTSFYAESCWKRCLTEVLLFNWQDNELHRVSQSLTKVTIVTLLVRDTPQWLPEKVQPPSWGYVQLSLSRSCIKTPKATWTNSPSDGFTLNQLLFMWPQASS